MKPLSKGRHAQALTQSARHPEQGGQVPPQVLLPEETLSSVRVGI